ncbi:phage protein TIGR01671,phage conserved hypothetical protein,YopX protein [[Clostridium] sordellii]|uniref:YopX family protein n=1 Tax=Paraclostridium sordellii TaxID=1505 RepID=UPI0005432DAE|nr:YopX family protein [Paeniclostridium sordellii]CEK35747.1 phage protein TIGR01671,phage conserved hypothetical protein,YopX protein [[Clostridium] sordellii] [Paeniclostridium sordellii]
MRDIKFRVWNIETGHMYKHEDLEQLITDIFKLDFIQGEFLPQGKGNVVMQYTGLKDKNGKEIYEGDIVQGGGLKCNDGFEILNDTSIVAFKYGMFKVGELSLCSLNNQCEVLGNIYINPELLK